MAQARVLIVDDEPDIREMLKDILEDEGYVCAAAADGAAAGKLRAEFHPDLILLDVWMPDIDGISLLREWRDAGALEHSTVVMISGHGTLETAVEATRLGAWDFIEKPLSIAKLLLTAGNALEAHRLRRRPAAPQPATDEARLPLGKHPVIHDLRVQVERLAQLATPLMILGKPGSGRRSLARWLHQHGRQPAAPFVEIEIETLNQNDWLDVLAGDAAQPGALRQTATGGVLYIEEPQTLPLAAQRWLAGVLEKGHFATAAGEQPWQGRLIVATRADPAAQVGSGAFDPSLHLILQAGALRLPGLDEHLDDIPDIVRHYAERLPGREGLKYRPFATAALNDLRQYRWPGDLRELINLVRRLLLSGGEGEIGLTEVRDALRTMAQHPAPAAGGEWYRLPLRAARERFEVEYLRYHLAECDGSVSRLAARVGMERTHLYRKLKALGIEPIRGGDVHVK